MPNRCWVGVFAKVLNFDAIPGGFLSLNRASSIVIGVKVRYITQFHPRCVKLRYAPQLHVVKPVPITRLQHGSQSFLYLTSSAAGAVMVSVQHQIV